MLTITKFSNQRFEIIPQHSYCLEMRTLKVSFIEFCEYQKY